jgi:hypothetical protein
VVIERLCLLVVPWRVLKRLSLGVGMVQHRTRLVDEIRLVDAAGMSDSAGVERDEEEMDRQPIQRFLCSVQVDGEP